MRGGTIVVQQMQHHPQVITSLQAGFQASPVMGRFMALGRLPHENLHVVVDGENM